MIELTNERCYFGTRNVVYIDSCTFPEIGTRLCFAVVWCRLIHPMSFWITSMALGQAYDCSSASDWRNLERYGHINHMNPLRTDYIATTIENTTQEWAYFYDIHVYSSILSTIDPCPHGYFTRAHNHRCYTYSYRYSYTWTEARDFCQTLGGHLLALETEKEFDEFIDWYLTGKVTVLKFLWVLT